MVINLSSSINPQHDNQSHFIMFEGIAVRKSKTTQQYLEEFFDLLGKLYENHKFTPDCVWNADEIGVDPAGAVVHMLSTNSNLRFQASSSGHVTVMLTTNASGEIAPAFFLFKAISDHAIPSEAVAPHWVSGNETAFMNEVEFQIWTLKFIEFIKEREQIRSPGSHRDQLLIVDGHNSRLQPDVLLTFTCANIHVLCIPSNTTHVLQPNDSGTNKSLKTGINNVLQKVIRGWSTCDNHTSCNSHQGGNCKSKNEVSHHQLLLSHRDLPLQQTRHLSHDTVRETNWSCHGATRGQGCNTNGI